MAANRDSQRNLDSPKSDDDGDLNPLAAIKNSAFMMIKPHANNDATKALVEAKLAEAGITITSEGEVAASGESGVEVVVVGGRSPTHGGDVDRGRAR